MCCRCRDGEIQMEVDNSNNNDNCLQEETIVQGSRFDNNNGETHVSSNSDFEVSSLIKRNPQWCIKTYSAAHSLNHRKVENSFQTSGIISTTEYNNVMKYPLSCESSPKEESPITGNRIVDLGYVLEWAIRQQYDHSKICTLGQLRIKGENRQGLSSTIIFTCTMCKALYEYSTENPNKTVSNINYGAVWGTLATGSSYSHLEELLSCMNVPPISDTMFYRIENEVGKEWESSLWRSMRAAGIEERCNAVEKGQLCTDGTPWITVYIDGSWSKRSYGTNFNSLAGMVGIIGKHTGELLFIAVRNKFYAICTRAANKDDKAKEHLCYKNWTESAPAMESDMAVEGFSCSEDMHGVRYLKFIADGDASVFAKIKERVSYGREVQKIECTNHALKNYGKNLRKIKADTQINLNGRKLLTQNKISKLVKRAKCSIYEHGKTDEKNVALFRADLKNNLHHVFGDHTECRDGICNTVGDQTENKITELKATSIYNHLYGANNLLVRKAHLLIENENNNRAEQLMNTISRFNMGKRLNLIQRGSYQRRVFLSGLRFNKHFKWHLSPWKKCTGQSPGMYLKKYVHKHSTAKSKSSTKKELFKDKNKKVKRTDLSKNSDYGAFATEPEDREDTDFIMMEAKLQMQVLQLSEEEIVNVQKLSVGQFGNKIYEKEREKRLTASLFGRIIKRRAYTPCHNLVKSCLQASVFYSEATEYGIAKENVAILKFEELTNLKVEKSGLWVDPVYGFLAASPDGLVGEDALVEVKCIYLPNQQFQTIKEVINLKKNNICLKINDSNISLKRNHNYYYQVQGQLNITKRERCYFIVYVNDKIPLYIEEINRDAKFWEEQMLPVLIQFYAECVAPEIIRGNLNKNQKCIDPPYINDAINLHRESKDKKTK